MLSHLLLFIQPSCPEIAFTIFSSAQFSRALIICTITNEIVTLCDSMYLNASGVWLVRSTNYFRDFAIHLFILFVRWIHFLCGCEPLTLIILVQTPQSLLLNSVFTLSVSKPLRALKVNTMDYAFHISQSSPIVHNLFVWLTIHNYSDPL